MKQRELRGKYEKERLGIIWGRKEGRRGSEDEDELWN